MVQNADKDFVCLAIDLFKFNGNKVYLVENPCREKVRSRIEAVQDFPLIAFHYRFELENIAY